MSTTRPPEPGGPTDPDQPDDAALLRAHVAGDPDAFGVLFARHRERLWAVALRTTGNREDAADGLQDGMIAAYRRAASFRGDARVTTWLHRVVVNACLDRLRAAAVRRAEPLPDDLERHAATTPTSFSPADAGTADPAGTTIVRERREQVLEALRTLPAEQRAALVLVDMEGYSVAEAAAVLACAEGTVKSRCSRGRARLAVLLAPLLESGTDDARRGGAAGNPQATPSVPSSSGPRAPPRPPAATS